MPRVKPSGLTRALNPPHVISLPRASVILAARCEAETEPSGRTLCQRCRRRRGIPETRTAAQETHPHTAKKTKEKNGQILRFSSRASVLVARLYLSVLSSSFFLFFNVHSATEYSEWTRMPCGRCCHKGYIVISFSFFFFLPPAEMF